MGVWFLAPMSGSLQLPVTLAPGESDVSGFCGHIPTHTYVQAHAYTHTHPEE